MIADCAGLSAPGSFSITRNRAADAPLALSAGAKCRVQQKRTVYVFGHFPVGQSRAEWITRTIAKVSFSPFVEIE